MKNTYVVEGIVVICCAVAMFVLGQQLLGRSGDISKGLRKAPEWAAKTILDTEPIPNAMPQSLYEKARNSPKEISLLEFEKGLRFAIDRCNRLKVTDESEHSDKIKRGCGNADMAFALIESGNKS